MKKTFGSGRTTTSKGSSSKDNEKCFSCSKAVYAAEKVSTGNDTFHKSCFRCANCKLQLTLLTYACLGNNYYCKAHYTAELAAGSGGSGDSRRDSKPPLVRSTSERVTPSNSDRRSGLLESVNSSGGTSGSALLLGRSRGMGENSNPTSRPRGETSVSQTHSPTIQHRPRGETDIYASNPVQTSTTTSSPMTISLLSPADSALFGKKVSTNVFKQADTSPSKNETALAAYDRRKEETKRKVEAIKQRQSMRKPRPLNAAVTPKADAEAAAPSAEEEMKRKAENDRKVREIREAAEKKRREEREKKEKEEEERRKQENQEAERRRKIEQEDREKREQENRKWNEEELRRKRSAEEEERRNADEEERRKIIEGELKRRADEEERKRKAEEDEQRRKVEEEDSKRRAAQEEAERKKKAREEERKRKAEEDESKRRAIEEEGRRRKAAALEEQNKKKREEEERIGAPPAEVVASSFSALVDPHLFLEELLQELQQQVRQEQLNLKKMREELQEEGMHLSMLRVELASM